MTMKINLKLINVDNSTLKALPNTGVGTFEFNITAPGGEEKYFSYTQEDRIINHGNHTL